MNIQKEELEKIIEKIKKFRFLYEQNEQAVRDQIVSPILRNLGWDPENPEEVQPNVSTEEGIPDYSLIKNEKKILLVEVKKLSIDVEQKEVIRQLGKYSFSEGIKYGILTNGAVWILIKAFEEGTSLIDRIVWKVDLENEEFSEIIRKLITVSKNNIENVEILVKKVQILEEVWRSLLEEPEEIIKGLMPVVKKFLIEGYPDYKFEDAEIEDLLKERIKEIISGSTGEEIIEEEMFPITSWKRESPRKMKIKGEIFELQYSFEILVNTANWLIRNNKIKPSDCPIGIGRSKRYLINIEPKHRYGNNFVSPKKLSNGLWIETHYSTVSCISYAKRLLEKFGFSPDILVIE